MTTPTTIPVMIMPEAAARIAELGMQREYQQMLQHALETVPSLRSIEVQLALPYDTGDETSIVLEAITELDATGLYQADTQWGTWAIHTFPPEVWSHIRMISFRGIVP